MPNARTELYTKDMGTITWFDKDDLIFMSKVQGPMQICLDRKVKG